jgi:RNA polymerase sigma-70 factor (ECF subfamily)
MEESDGRYRLKELEHVITEFQEQLFRFAFFRTGSFADSQDIVQDVFIKLYQDNRHLTAVNNLKYYLFRSISNACYDYHRKNRKYQFDPIDTVIIPDERNEKEASHPMLLMEEFSRIDRLFSELPNDQAETIRLRVLDNLSFVEISQILEIPVTTVKSRFKYGMDKLKSKMVKTKEVNYGM